MNDFLKRKIASVVLLIAVLVSMVFVPARAHAVWGVEDIVFDPQALVEMVVEYAGEAMQWAEENWEEVMRDVIAKRIIDYTVDETVKWVQGGGDPKFVSDWNGFMQEAGAMAFDSVIKEAGLTDICQPFKFQLNIALIPEERIKKERVECSISDIVANVQNFYDNFQNGGWLAYGASIKPENNLYMQLVMFDDEIKLKSSFNADVKRQQSAAGQGFLSVSKCIEDDSQALYDQCVAEGGDPNVECYDYANQNKTCTKEKVQTPGSMVGKALGESITSDTQWAANIQTWTSALVNAAIKRVMKEGVAAMTGSKADAAPNYDPARSEYGDILSEQLSQEAKRLVEQIKVMAQPYEQLFAELQKRKGYEEQTLDSLQQIDILDTNKICIPRVTADEIAAQKAVIANVQKEYDAVKPIVDSAATAIKQVTQADNTVRGRALAQSAAGKFIGSYSSLDAQQNTSARVQSAIAETSIALDKRNETQNRFTQCKNKIDLLKPQTSSTQ